MKNLFVISYSGFSDQDANGKTLKSLLKSWSPNHLMQFYAGNQKPDFSFCHRFFHVTDHQIVKSCFGKKSQHYFESSPISTNDSTPVQAPSIFPSESKRPGKITRFLKRNKYNYIFRTLREFLWLWSPWGKKELYMHIQQFSPDAIFYMVGDSFAFDHMLIKILRRFPVPLVLYNAEAYRIVDLDSRHGLEKLYCKKIERTYKELHKIASLVIYNSSYLERHYRERYSSDCPSVVAYNADCFGTPFYQNCGVAKHLAYFGNLGVGRCDSLLDIAEAIRLIDQDLYLDIYGSTTPENIKKFKDAGNIHFWGFVGPDVLQRVLEEADILIHAESFDPKIMPKLKYAFSTKIAQYLCSGRCLVSYAPKDMASTQYLIENDCAVIITARDDLEAQLRSVIWDGTKRSEYAHRAYLTAKTNHDQDNTASQVLKSILSVISCENQN